MYNSEKKRKNLKKEKKRTLDKWIKKKKKNNKRLSLKYLTTVTTWTVLKAYRVRGEATIPFTHFRSF